MPLLLRPQAGTGLRLTESTTHSKSLLIRLKRCTYGQGAMPRGDAARIEALEHLVCPGASRGRLHLASRLRELADTLDAAEGAEHKEGHFEDKQEAVKEECAGIATSGEQSCSTEQTNEQQPASQPLPSEQRSPCCRPPGNLVLRSKKPKGMLSTALAQSLLSRPLGLCSSSLLVQMCSGPSVCVTTTSATSPWKCFTLDGRTTALLHRPALRQRSRCLP